MPILTATKTLKSRIFTQTYNLPFTRNGIKGLIRGGSRGRVQGVRTPPPEMTCGFLNNWYSAKKKNYVVYWCWRRARGECTPPKKILDPPLLVHTNLGKKICGLKNQSGFFWTGLTSVSEKRVLIVGIKEKYKDVRCLNLIWVKKVKWKTQLSDWLVLLIIKLEILPAEYMYMYPHHEPVSRVLNYKYCFILKKIVVGQVRS